MLKFRNNTVKSPSKMFVVFFNITSKPDRNAAGNEVMDRFGRKRRLELEWAYLTPTEMSTLLTNADKDSLFFDVTYHDPETDTAKTMTARVSNLEMGIQRYSGTSVIGWEDVKMELTEQ